MRQVEEAGNKHVDDQKKYKERIKRIRNEKSVINNSRNPKPSPPDNSK